MAIFELDDMYKELQNKIEKGEIPEEAIEDTLEAVEGEFKHKANKIACMIKNWDIEGNSLEKEAENFLKRAESKKRKSSRAKNYLFSEMVEIGLLKIETVQNLISIKQNPAKLEVHPGFVGWAQTNNEDLLKYQTPLPNKTAIKAALQAGVDIPYVEIKKTERLEIK